MTQMRLTSNPTTGNQQRLWTGALLSGGASKRMGQDKLVLQFPDGTFLLDRPARALQESCGTCLLVGSESRSSTVAAEFLATPDFISGEGPLSALLGAMTVCQTPWLLLLGGDMPSITSNHLTDFQRRAEKFPDHVLMAESPNGLEPLCSAWPAALFPHVKARWESGTRALRDAVSAEFLQTYRIYSEGQVPTMNDPFRNINHPGDWETLLAEWKP